MKRKNSFTVLSIQIIPVQAIKSFILLLLTFALQQANAQNLPNSQLQSLQAPKNILIDGKVSEWLAGFQAYNKSTDIFYSIANDQENIYLIVMVKDPLIIRKVIDGGITFTTNLQKKETGVNSHSITYPVYNDGSKPAFNLKELQTQVDANLKGRGSDSLLTATNREFSVKTKEIEVLGFKEITDTVISIYNEYGIKAAATFNHNIALTYEMAVPLRLLNLTAVTAKSFYYNIKLNGYRVPPLSAYGTRPPPPPPVPFKDRVIYSPTDFWASYSMK